jgi:UDPglucose 6-dehydrogenase
MNGIIGYGFVGQAIGSVLKEPFIVVDPVHPEGFSLNVLLEHNPEIIFICVPTPTKDQGCDDSLILDYIQKLKDFNGTVVIKSTIPPETVEKIQVIRPVTVVWPELLREAHAKEDIKNPKIIVIGAQRETEFEILLNFIQENTNINTCPIKHVKPTEASIFKYTVNSFLALKVVFMHQMYQWLETRGNGESWDNIAELLKLEGRIGQSHLKAPGEHGLGFSGTCFPKDTEALVWQASQDNFDMSLLSNAIQINKEKLRNQ